MKAQEFIELLNEGSVTLERTCDTVKSGDASREIHKVGVTMFATVDTVRAAKEWGADLLIVHEPTYYDHMDNIADNPVCAAKRALIEESGIIIYRYHDHAHFRDLDQITEGELHYLGLTGKVEDSGYSASYIFTSDEAVTALELARRMEEDLGIAHVRIAGARDLKSTKIAACFGTPGGVYELLRNENIEIVLTGETCEWMVSEYARDAAALGYNKSMIVMGHIGSERDGMRLICERIKENYPEFETRYFECGEVYTYTDSENL